MGLQIRRIRICEKATESNAHDIGFEICHIPILLIINNLQSM